MKNLSNVALKMFSNSFEKSNELSVSRNSDGYPLFGEGSYPYIKTVHVSEKLEEAVQRKFFDKEVLKEIQKGKSIESVFEEQKKDIFFLFLFKNVFEQEESDAENKLFASELFDCVTNFMGAENVDVMSALIFEEKTPAVLKTLFEALNCKQVSEKVAAIQTLAQLIYFFEYMFNSQNLWIEVSLNLYLKGVKLNDFGIWTAVVQKVADHLQYHGIENDKDLFDLVDIVAMSAQLQLVSSN